MKGLRPLDQVIGPGFALGELGGELRGTLQMLDEVGFQT